MQVWILSAVPLGSEAAISSLAQRHQRHGLCELPFFHRILASSGQTYIYAADAHLLFIRPPLPAEDEYCQNPNNSIAPSISLNML